MSSPGPTRHSRVKEWFKELKEDVRDGFGRLTLSRPSSPHPRSADRLAPDTPNVAAEAANSSLRIVTGGTSLTRTQSSPSYNQASPDRNNQLAGVDMTSAAANDLQLPVADSSNSPKPDLSHSTSDPTTISIQSAPRLGRLFYSQPPSRSSSPQPTSRRFLDDPVGAPPSASSGVKDALKTSLTFTQTLLKKLPDLVDGNPVKIALGLAKTIIEIKDAVKDNMNATERRIASTAEQLLILSDAQVDDWGVGDPEKPWLDKFESVLSEELEKLRRLDNGSMIKRVAAHEDEKSELAESFERINEARMQFELYTNIRVYRAVNRIEVAAAGLFLTRLQPSHMADHKYLLEGKKREALHREPCSPGTRVSIVDGIVKWANDPDSQDIFWLFGPAGSGKTTIAYTIARRFESTRDPDDIVVLGGNFFCSRQFDETKHKGCIIRTIAYQLAHKCKGFADALYATEGLDSIIHQDVPTQLQGLLIDPWYRYRSAYSKCSTDTARFLFLLDALDEIDQGGGSIFLRDLLKILNRNHLPGLKFFVTSRSDPDIVSRLDSFDRRQLLRLQDVEKEEAQRDIATYLVESLPLLKDSDEMKGLQEFAGELFICAATVVRHLTPKDTSRSEQKFLLARLLSSSATKPTADNATQILDELYLQLLCDAFSHFHKAFFADKLSILHTFLCTMERTSAVTVAKLLSPDGLTDDANRVLLRLHAVLYVDNHSNVLTYHKSFTDFLFDRSRSKQFACDEDSQHRLLTEHCFRIMHAGLRFNIANIRSSFVLDNDITNLQAEVKRSISPELSYSCRSWSRHLVFTPLTGPSDPILVTLSEFLKIRVLFWIETMNLLKCVGECDPDLCRASTWASEYHPALSQHLQQSGSFALYFTGSAASKSTPHLYVSALATWHEDDGPTVTWRRHFPKIPHFKRHGRRRSACLMVLSGSSSVHSMALSRDGAMIVSGSLDGAIQIWDAQTGKQLKVLEGHTKSVYSVAISRDGTRIVSGSGDKSVRIWDVQTGKQLKVLKGHKDWVRSVAFSEDGTYIISGADDTTVKIWDVRTGDQLKVLEGHTNLVFSVAISRDGTRIVSGSADKSVRIWDVQTGKRLKVLEGHKDYIGSVAFSEDSTCIISGSSDKTARIWDARTGDQLKALEGHTAAVQSVAISSDGTRIVSGSGDKSMRIWDVRTGKQLKVMEGHTQVIVSVAISVDGARIISGSGDNTVRIWEVQSREELEKLEEPEEPEGHESGLRSAAVSEDGTCIISGSDDKTVRIWDAQTGKQLKVLEGHTAAVQSVAISSDGTRIVSGSGDKSVRIWDVQTGKQLKVLKGHKDWVRSVAFSEDGTYIISGADDTTVKIWDVRTGDQLKVLEGHTNLVFSVAISRDGTRIVSGSADKSVRIWDVQTGKRLKVLEGHKGHVRSVAFSEDSACIISGSSDKTARIWDARTGDQLKALEGHTAYVYSVAISRDGTRIVSGSGDKSVRIWDVQTGRQLTKLVGHEAEVYTTAFSEDGTRIISGSEDFSVRIWHAYGKEQRKAVAVPADGTSKVIAGVHDEQSAITWPSFTLGLGEGGRPTGWLLSLGTADYLMFVPLAERPLIFPCLSILSSRPFTTVNLENADLGEEWHKCYDPSPSAFSTIQ